MFVEIVSATYRLRKLGKERVPERVPPGRSCCFSFCLSWCLSQTGLRFRDCNHIVEFVFVEFVSGTYLLRSKKTRKKSSPGKGGTRFWKSIVLGFKTPREAIEGMSLLYVNDENPLFNDLSLL
ncbi:40S ribosomal protein S11 [Glycine soja]